MADDVRTYRSADILLPFTHAVWHCLEGFIIHDDYTQISFFIRSIKVLDEIDEFMITFSKVHTA